jgi:hypothetical protein
MRYPFLLNEEGTICTIVPVSPNLGKTRITLLSWVSRLKSIIASGGWQALQYCPSVTLFRVLGDIATQLNILRGCGHTRRLLDITT